MERVRHELNERGETKSGNQDTTYLDSKEGDRIERVKKDGNYPTVLCVCVPG